MEPSDYIPAYLERVYLSSHEGLTDAARALLHNQVRSQPERYAADAHATSLLAYAAERSRLIKSLDSMENLDDDEFERESNALFDRERAEMYRIWNADNLCVDARLLDILLADAPLDDCLNDLLKLEGEVRSYLEGRGSGFDTSAEGYWDARSLGAAGLTCEEATVSDPEVVGWLHTVEAISQACLSTGRYRAAANYARIVMGARGYRSAGAGAAGTLLLALARLEDEDGFFSAARDAGAGIEDTPWFLLGRTLLMYKLGRVKNARRALRDFSARCEGGAFFLLNPTYQTPYLPVRPKPRDPWDASHQAVWEADGVIVDTPDFVTWAASVDGVERDSEDFALRYGF